MSSKFPTYRRPVSPTWFLARRSYTLFMLRELSSLFGAGVALLQLYLVTQIGQGPSATNAALAVFSNPLVIVFHVVAAFFLGLHVVTWFKLNAHIMEIRTGETVVPRASVVTTEYVAFAIVTAILVLVLAL